MSEKWRGAKYVLLEERGVLRASHGSFPAGRSLAAAVVVVVVALSCASIPVA